MAPIALAEVNAVPLAELAKYLSAKLEGVTTLGREADDSYRAVAAKAALDPAVFKRTKLKVAFTNIHGTGSVNHVAVSLKLVLSFFFGSSQRSSVTRTSAPARVPRPR